MPSLLSHKQFALVEQADGSFAVRISSPGGLPLLRGRFATRADAEGWMFAERMRQDAQLIGTEMLKGGAQDVA
jgi:hypothetical protein